MMKELSTKQKRIIDDYIYLSKQHNHLTSEIIRIKRMIELLGDNEYTIKYLSSLEHERYYCDKALHDLVY